jgi:hypothetical protein
MRKKNLMMSCCFSQQIKVLFIAAGTVLLYILILRQITAGLRWR